MPTKRRTWRCPHCGTRWDIPTTAADPASCPKCPPDAASPEPTDRRKNFLADDGFTPASAKTKAQSLRILIAIGAAAGLVAVVGLVALNRGVFQSVTAIVPIGRQDHELTLVDEFLRKNLDDPEYEVVQWWPARSLRQVHLRYAEELEKQIDESKLVVTTAEAEIEGLKRRGVSPPDWRPKQHPPLNQSDEHKKWRECLSKIHDANLTIDDLEESLKYRLDSASDLACRLKYRIRNEFGAKILVDDYFIIDGDKVYIPISWSSDRTAAAEMMSGEKPRNIPAEAIKAAIDAQR